MLPNLIVIGAAKAGTTSLHYYLNLHPEIAMVEDKELHFFSHDRRWHLGVTWYEAHFSGSEAMHGETSPSYTMFPTYPDPPARMHAVVPDARLLYVVRDPVERLISHWTFAHSYGGETRPFVECIRDPASRYVATSRYFRQIERYLQWFAPSQILIVSNHELNRNLRGVMRRVFGFLGVDESFWGPGFDLRLNETRFQRRKSPFGRRLSRVNRWALVRRMPIRWRVVAGRYLYMPFSSRVDRPVVDDALRRELVDLLAEDAGRFRRWAGQPFGEWTL